LFTRKKAAQQLVGPSVAIYGPKNGDGLPPVVA